MIEQLAGLLPQTWHGWAAIAALVVYLLCREWIHRAIKRASQ